MNRLRNLIITIGVSGILATFGGCKDTDFSKGESEAAKEPTIEQSRVLSYEEFKANAIVEEWSGIYIINGDEAVGTEKKLREYYERYIQQENSTERNQSVVRHLNGVDSIWNEFLRKNITYCISDNLGTRKSKVISAMDKALKIWEDVAEIDYTYLPAQDANCDEKNNAVTFDVRGYGGHKYIARAFSPDSPRNERTLLIQDRVIDNYSETALIGVVLHELGHTLGLRHEHIRPKPGEPVDTDVPWRPLTPYDPESIMYYDAFSSNPYNETLTLYDKQAIASLYNHKNSDFDNRDFYATFYAEGHVNKSDWKHFLVQGKPGWRVYASLHGVNDADLFVKGGSIPNNSNYDCRSTSITSQEYCDVSHSDQKTYISVKGYTDSDFKLSIKFAPVDGKVANVSTFGIIQKGEWLHSWFSLQNNTNIKAVTTVHANDIDLYLRKDFLPTRSDYDCRSTKANDSDEACDLNSENAQLAYVSLYGYSGESTLSNFFHSVEWNIKD